MIIEVKKQSKPISELKENDKIKVNDKEMIVDNQFVFIDHGTMKEMVIEFYNAENEREYQLRYFDDQIETSIEVYELVGDFQYIKREPKTVEW